MNTVKNLFMGVGADRKIKVKKAGSDEFNNDVVLCADTRFRVRLQDIVYFYREF
jgi:hypothetical protein